MILQLSCAGVSNFGIDELAELLAMARIKPALVQRHSDPLAPDSEVQAFCRIAGIQYQVRPAERFLPYVSHDFCTRVSTGPSGSRPMCRHEYGVARTAPYLFNVVFRRSPMNTVDMRIG